jgi:chemotaxis protein MotB
VLQTANSDLRIERHTDNVPIHNSHFSSNWDLSIARATATIRLLMTKYNFAPQRLAASGYSEYRPIASNATDEGRSMNRRVDIVVPRKLRSM